LELLRDIKVCLMKYNIPFVNHGKQQGNIIAMPVSDPMALFEHLKANNIYIKPIKDVARLSFIHETTLNDIETAAKHISKWIKLSSPKNDYAQNTSDKIAAKVTNKPQSHSLAV